MKIYIAALLCAALSTTEAYQRGPRVQLDRCFSGGDPHYEPVFGKRQKFTMMGAGEFKLAEIGDFGVHTCQEDLTKNIREGSMAQRDITWNKHVVVWDGSHKVEVQVDGTVTIRDGDSTVSTASDVFAKGQTFTYPDQFNKDTPVLVRKAQSNKAKLEIKFNSGRAVTIAYQDRRGGRFKDRKFFDVTVRVEKNADGATGLCYERKGTTNAHQVTTNSEFLNGLCGGTPEVAQIVDLTEQINIAQSRCPKLVARAFSVCRNNDNQHDDCVFDIVEGCETDGLAEELADVEQATKELEEIEEDAREFTCPRKSYVSKDAAYPLTSFADCDCEWGYEKNEDGDACVPHPTVDESTFENAKKDFSVKPVERCFCHPGDINHCMNPNLGDNSCVPPVLRSDQSKKCTDPIKAANLAECVCAQGTMDCSKKDYSIRELRAPGLAVPDNAFGQQPVFALFDGNKIETGTSDASLRMRISIANVQPETCRCSGDKPCIHNNHADNTCFAKQELFGDLVCPAGTTECIAEESNVKLFRKDPENADLERKDKTCQHTNTANTDFCSAETPCKQINDGTCMPKQTYNRPVVDEDGVIDAPRPTEFCGVTDWRRTQPSPVRGWFFDTDATCNMNIGGALGCTDPNHRYAMDKWCDHNCNPSKYGRPGQPAYCPESHCEKCADNAKTPEPKAKGWRCPLEQYTDGSCFCSSGTELCGAIEVQAVNGIVSFEHLTIGKPGKYQLLVELVQADSNTGSNMPITATSSVFEVRYPSEGAECRAQPQWRQDDLDKSPVHGAGKSWFFQDTSFKCSTYNADGTCKAQPKRVYAMDKWCKANRCAEHTLLNHCTKEATTSFPAETCDKNVFDMFGDCCDSGRVDQCGVCDGDGTTCELSYYLSTFADEPDPEVVAQLENDALKNRHCPVFAPCAHINKGDESCVPKTFNSAVLVDEDFEYCPFNSKLGNYRKGSWDDAAGLASKKVLHADGNNDCFCPEGTVDLTGKAKVEAKMEQEFKEEVIEKVTETIKRVEEKTGGTVTEAEIKELTEARITKVTQENKVELFNQPCGGAKKDQRPTGSSVGVIEIADGHNHPLAGHAFKLDGDREELFSKGKVKCIGIPGGCNVKAFVGQLITPKTTVDIETTTFERFENEKKDTKFVNIEVEQSEKVEQVKVGGKISDVKAQVLGTPLSAAEEECKFKLRAEVTEFAAALQGAKSCVNTGGDVIQCIQRHAGDVTTEAKQIFGQFMQCVMRSKIVAQAQAKAQYAAAAAKAAAQRLASKFQSRVKSTGWYRRRLVGEAVVTQPTGTQFVGRVGASGNTGLGSTSAGTQGTSFGSSLRTGTGQSGTGFGLTAPSSPPAGAASGGLSAGMTALVALVSVGALVGAAVGAKRFRDGGLSKPEAASRDMATTGAGKEDCTDVL